MQVINYLNPMGDTMFKLMMAKQELGVQLLSSFLDLKVVRYTDRSQEVVVPSEEAGKAPHVYRRDFLAVVEQDDGSLVQVIIEVQRQHRPSNQWRFRRYVSGVYSEQPRSSKQIEDPLPLLAVFIHAYDVLQLGEPIVDATISLRGRLSGH
jgi:hypothetical protein